jgi:hypothetical protein
MAEYNVDEYNVEGEDTQYNLKISLVDNKINLQLTETVSEGHGKNYEGEFTLEELRQINRVFQLTPTIYDAQEEFKKAVERQKIALSENEAYVNIMFQMVLGTDNSPFVIALPRNESARIVQLEQDNDLLKLERDNLLDKLELIKKNTNEIMEITAELENENYKLKNETNKVENDMSISAPIKPINPIQSYKITSSNNNEGINRNENMNQNYNNNQNNNINMINNMNSKNNLIQNQNQNNMNNNLRQKNNNQQVPNQNAYKSSTYNRNNKPNPSASQNLNKNPKNMEIKNQPPQNQQNQQNLQNQQNQPKPQQQKIMKKRFPNGILFNILKSEKEIANVTQRIQGYLNKNIHYSLLYYARAEGDKASTFHKKCDKARKSLVLIMDSFGNRFGGFTMRDWAGKAIQKKDEKAFIFSLDKNKIYGVLPDQVAIGCYPNFGPIFFGCQIRVYDNFFTKGGSTYLKGLNYATEEDYELTNGNQIYGIKELEVYEVKEVKQ